jgi:acetate kinase
VSELKRLQPLDPEHLPAEIALIQAFTQRLPRVPQIACFDTAFHHDLPRVAQLLPIPRRYQSAGVRRYGFHGLSYTYLLRELARTAGEEVAEERVILAHLGAGCSMAAVRGGKCVDTTMAFTPSAGLMMGTRSGDLDPGVLIHLMRSEGLSAEQIDEQVNHRSGLLGVSETSPDMRDLLARRESDLRAAEAVELFCHSAKKWVGALAASLGGLDTLVFSGGVGENADGVVSTDGSPVVVHVIRTDEESIIVREAQRLAGVSIAEPAHVS